MVRRDDIRPAEQAAELPTAVDASLIFIGRIHTPWTSRADCPRQGRCDGPVCRIEVFARWREALAGVEKYPHLEVLYWLHLSRRDLVLQSPRHDARTHGTFSLRSPVRPNPIGTSIVQVVGIEQGVLSVRGLDCVDGTPLIDLKPDRSVFTPVARSTSGDAELG